MSRRKAPALIVQHPHSPAPRLADRVVPLPTSGDVLKARLQQLIERADHVLSLVDHPELYRQREAEFTADDDLFPLVLSVKQGRH